MPRWTYGNDLSADFCGDVLYRTSDLILRLRHLLSRPREIQRDLWALLRNFGRKQSDILVIAQRILNRQRRLFLQHDEIPRRCRYRFLRDPRIPVPAKARAAGEDCCDFHVRWPLSRRGQVHQQARQLIARRVAVADEQNSNRRAPVWRHRVNGYQILRSIFGTPSKC